jgi:hypothetical protein
VFTSSWSVFVLLVDGILTVFESCFHTCSTEKWQDYFLCSRNSMIHWHDIWVWRATVEWYWQGKTEELGEKPVPVPLWPTQIPHGARTPGLCSERLAINRLSHGTTYVDLSHMKFGSILYWLFFTYKQIFNYVIYTVYRRIVRRILSGELEWMSKEAVVRGMISERAECPRTAKKTQEETGYGQSASYPRPCEISLTQSSEWLIYTLYLVR